MLVRMCGGDLGQALRVQGCREAGLKRLIEQWFGQPHSDTGLGGEFGDEFVCTRTEGVGCPDARDESEGECFMGTDWAPGQDDLLRAVQSDLTWQPISEPEVRYESDSDKRGCEDGGLVSEDEVTHEGQTKPRAGSMTPNFGHDRLQHARHGLTYRFHHDQLVRGVGVASAHLLYIATRTKGTLITREDDNANRIVVGRITEDPVEFSAHGPVDCISGLRTVQLDAEYSVGEVDEKGFLIGGRGHALIIRVLIFVLESWMCAVAGACMKLSPRSSVPPGHVLLRSQTPAPADGQNLPGDIGRLLGSKKGYGVCDVLRSADAASGDLLDELR